MSDIRRFIEVQREANGLLQKYGLSEQGWKFEFSNTQRRIGDCSHNQKTIRYSKHYMSSDPASVTDTLLHEIAHALVDPKHGHNHVWRAMCLKIGANPDRTPDIDKQQQTRSTAKKNYRIKCEDCGWYVDRFRFKKSFYFDKNRDIWCPRCESRNLQYYKLEWK